MILCGESSYAVYSLYSCLLHESGHIAALFINGQPVKKLVFYGAGIKIIRSENDIRGNFAEEFTALASGCGVNFLIYAVSLLFTGNFRLFGIINLITGLFNAMPFSFLDGGKLIVLIFYRFFPCETALRLENCLKSVNIITVPAAAIILYIAGMRNFTVYVTLIFLLFMSLQCN